MNSKYGALFVVTLLLTTSWFAMPSISTIRAASAQGPKTSTDAIPYQVNVAVTNNGNTNLLGSIHVISSSTGAVKNANGITFPAGQTVTQIFKINQSEIPKGTEFAVEVVYGDDYSIRAYGVNNQADNIPELFNMNIP
jgi:hypothetical protein